LLKTKETENDPTRKLRPSESGRARSLKAAISNEANAVGKLQRLSAVRRDLVATDVDLQRSCPRERGGEKTGDPYEPPAINIIHCL
jgi:hypothetical protein